jgi:hypothetical protein
MSLKWSDRLTGFYDEDDIKFPKIILAGSCSEAHQEASFISIFDEKSDESHFVIFKRCG